MKSLSKHIVPQGTVELPAISVAGNPDTGIYFPTVDTLAIAINGVQVLLVDENGLPTNAGGATTKQGNDADAYRIDQDSYGFLNQTETTKSMTGDVFTLAPTGTSWSYYRTGIKYTVTGSKSVTLPAPTATTTAYFIFIDSTDGTLSQSTSAWTLFDTRVPVSIVVRNSTMTPVDLIEEERHTTKILRRDHMIEHYTTGTLYSSGGALTGPTVGSNTNSAKTCAVTPAWIFDEDIYQSTVAIAAGDGATNAFYTVAYRTALTSWAWQRSVVPFKYSGAGAIQFDNAGTMTAANAGVAVNARWINYFMMLTNIEGQESVLWIPGRAQHTTIGAANSELFSSFDMTGFVTKDAIAIYRFTWVTSGSGLGLCNLVQTPVRISTNILQSTSSSTVAHDLLSGLGLAGAGVTYGHIDDQAQTIAGAKTFTGAITASNLSNTNTGDETTATIKSKLGITTLSGSNTGDQVIPSALPTPNTVTFAASGGLPPGSSFNGSAARVVDYSTVGAQPADPDLSAIASLSGGIGYLRKLSDNNWEISEEGAGGSSGYFDGGSASSDYLMEQIMDAGGAA